MAVRPDGKTGLAVVQQQIDLPARECSTCHIGQECPEYQEGYVCFFDERFKGWELRSSDGILNAMTAMIAKNMERLQMAYLTEQIVMTGQVDPGVTRLSEVVMNQMANYANMRRNLTSVSVTMRGPDMVKKTGGGVLQRIFGGGPTEKPADILLNPDEASPEEVIVTVSKSGDY